MTIEDTKTFQLALGRIFRLMSRPEKDGDVADYERCRSIIFDVVNPPPFVDRAPDYGRDRIKGAQGD
jgi:hypothetical protein